MREPVKQPTRQPTRQPTVTPDYVFCFLGNPGSEYQETRHNIGFMVADAFAKRRSTEWIHRDPLFDEAVVTYARKTCMLIKPLTYMNLSGNAVRKVIAAHQLQAKHVVVVVDEYNFPVGRVHLRSGGSSGGHNGVASVEAELKSAAFWRLRCGIDRNFGPGGLVPYVLSPFDPEESAGVQAMVERACDALELILKHGPPQAMNGINRSEPAE